MKKAWVEIAGELFTSRGAEQSNTLRDPVWFSAGCWMSFLPRAFLGSERL